MGDFCLTFSEFQTKIGSFLRDMAAGADAAARAGAIILIQNPDAPTEPFVLVGRESKYLSDIYTYIDFGDGRGPRSVREDLQRAPPKDGVVLTLEEARILFAHRADAISKQLGQRVLYDPPVYNEDSKTYFTNFRIQGPGSKWGITKGGLEAVDGGSFLACIQRELKEELTLEGILLQPVGRIDRYEIFTSLFTDAQYRGLVDRFNTYRIQKYRGEILEIAKIPLKSFDGADPAFNQITRDALTALRPLLLPPGWGIYASKTKGNAYYNKPGKPSVYSYKEMRAQEAAEAAGATAGSGGGLRKKTHRRRRSKQIRTRKAARRNTK
jgi:8-oxo-dGTP pyrophosphatase MutT (NUDIX family)